MTLYKPTIQLNRLRVKRGGHIAFDGEFHRGVNIIHGFNSSGKTTILDFIAHVLGAENIEWKPQALLCDSVYAEVALNRVPITLLRAVSDSSQLPVSIYWGPLAEAEAAAISAWEVYPFRRSQTKESFSQVLFRALELPEVRVADANLTMHQLLRILYVDQRSPNNSILRTEQFDQVLTKETLERYIFGLYDDRLYEAQLRLRELDGEQSEVISEIKTLISVLQRAGQQTDFESVATQIASLQDEQDELSKDLARLSGSGAANRTGRDPGVSELRAKLSKTKARLAAAQDERLALALDIEDSERFVTEIERRVRGLSESAAAREYLGKTTFDLCPCCLSPLVREAADDTCHLCKSRLGSTAATSQLLRMRNELQIQHEESDRLLSGKRGRLARVDAEIPAIQAELKGLEREYSRRSENWLTEDETRMQGVARRLGEIDEQIKQMLQFQKLGTLFAELSRKREGLASEVARLRTVVESIENAEERRKAEAHLAVSYEAVRLLRDDLPRVSEFAHAEEVTWSFVENRVSVNGVENFSESSSVILRHSFHLAMLIASAKHEFFRLPRFMLIDGIEDGGIEPARSFHFQNLLVARLSALEADHQVIYATSGIAPNLDRNDLVVGRAFTPEKKSLDVPDAGPGFLPLTQ